MQKLKYLKYFSILLKCIASTDSDVCINVTEGTKGTIKSIDREYVTCPAWYQVWKGFEKCYPAREFNWCWQLRNVSKLLLQTRHLIGGEITCQFENKSKTQLFKSKSEIHKICCGRTKSSTTQLSQFEKGGCLH